VGYRDEGTLVIALTRDDAEQLRFTFELQRRLGLEIDWLSGATALDREPHINPRITAACFSPRDHQVDNRAVATALIAAFRGRGGTLHERAEVDGIDLQAGIARGVVVAGARHPADVVVLAAGAWSHGVAGLPEAARPAVRPVKGQMLAVRMDPTAPLLRHVVWAPRSYLVPRSDGRLIIGGTVEERGFDPSLTAGGIMALLEGAWRALPGIEERPIDEMWVGFRPGSPDDAPMLGPTAVPGLIVASGHHRNGILLTPITADTISAYILTGVLPEAIQPFGIDRFQARPNPARMNQAQPSQIRRRTI
jgi:glycine oxidase